MRRLFAAGLTLAFVLAACAAPALAQTDTQVLVIGDSISAGCAPPPGQPPYVCTVPPDQAWPHQLQLLWNAKVPTVVNVLAVNGTRSDYWNSDPRIPSAAAGASQVIIELGMNDHGTCVDPATSGMHQIAIADQVRAAAPTAKISILRVYQPFARWPCANNPFSSPTWGDYAYWSSVAASAAHVGFVDVRPDFPAYPPSTWMLPDGIHPTVAGHRRLAQAVASRVPSP